MNDEIIRKTFPEMFELVKNKKCPFCKKKIIIDEFKNDLSLKEYKISGLCQKCQDETFE